MHILLTGASGFVGQELLRFLILKGHTVTAVVRNAESFRAQCGLPCNIWQWDLAKEVAPSKKLNASPGLNHNEIQAVVHLAGESVAQGPWTPSVRKAILESRVKGTSNLIEYFKKENINLNKFISASAIGIYQSQGDKFITENDLSENNQKNFLSHVCQEWERSLDRLPNSVAKTSLRIGLVLGRGKGLLGKLEPLYHFGLGSRLGSGKQWMSWIHIEDLVRIIDFCLQSSKLPSAMNAVAPNPVTNAEFSRLFAAQLGRREFIPVPSFALRTLLGDFGQNILDSQRVIPKALLDLGFQFKFNHIELALKNIFCHYPDQEKSYYQYIEKPIETVFDFFSKAENLERITPDTLQFKIENKSTDAIQQGTEIVYKLNIHGIPVRWKTLIAHWQPPNEFIDTQLKGPYKKWHHTHHFQKLNNGVFMTDTVLYRLPLGRLGDLVAGAFVARDVEKIFSYRMKVIKEIFGL